MQSAKNLLYTFAVKFLFPEPSYLGIKMDFVFLFTVYYMCDNKVAWQDTSDVAQLVRTVHQPKPRSTRLNVQSRSRTGKVEPVCAW